MKVSVVVPAYNVAEFLDECLCSVLGEADGDVGEKNLDRVERKGGEPSE